jgi:hypothetical protein
MSDPWGRRQWGWRRRCAARRQHIVGTSSLQKLGASGFGTDPPSAAGWHGAELHNVGAIHTDANLRIRFENSFAKELDETLVSPKDQISQKIRSMEGLGRGPVKRHLQGPRIIWRPVMRQSAGIAGFPAFALPCPHSRIASRLQLIHVRAAVCRRRSSWAIILVQILIYDHNVWKMSNCPRRKRNTAFFQFSISTMLRMQQSPQFFS